MLKLYLGSVREESNLYKEQPHPALNCTCHDVTLIGLVAHLKCSFTTGAKRATVLSRTPALKVDAQQTFPSHIDSNATFSVWRSPTSQPRTANSFHSCQLPTLFLVFFFFLFFPSALLTIQHTIYFTQPCLLFSHSTSVRSRRAEILFLLLYPSL